MDRTPTSFRVAVTGVVERKQMMRVGLIVGLPSALFVLLFFCFQRGNVTLFLRLHFLCGRLALFFHPLFGTRKSLKKHFFFFTVACLKFFYLHLFFFIQFILHTDHKIST